MRVAQRTCIRVLVVVDKALVRHGILSVLGPDPNLEIVGESATADDGLQKAVALRPDVVLVDMMAESAVATRAIKRRCPDTRILVLSDTLDPDFFGEVTHAGAAGHVLTDITPADLVGALHAVHNGTAIPDRHIPDRRFAARRDLAAVCPHRPLGFTPREVSVLRGVAAGLSDKEIANQLFVSESTVKGHLKNVYRRYSIRNRAHAAVVAVENGLLASKLA